MEQPFSWRSFDQMARALQSVGYLVIVFGPLVGLAVVILASGMMRVVGIAVIGASFFLALYPRNWAGAGLRLTSSNPGVMHSRQA